MATLIPPTPAANKSAEQHQEPSEQDSFNHLSLQGSEVDFRTSSRPQWLDGTSRDSKCS